MFKPKAIISRPLKVILLLALALSFSMVGVTLGMYVKQVNLFGDGWIGPKYYAFEVQSNAFNQSVTPGSSATYPFTVSNYNNGGVAQIPLNVTFSIMYPTNFGGTGKVNAVLTCGGTVLGSSETGTLDCNGILLPKNEKTTDQYTLTLTWKDIDMALLSDIKSSAFDPSQISIRVSGYQ